MAEAVWPLHGDGRPTWREPASGHQIATFDPFPGYRHDWAMAERTLKAVAESWPPAWDITVHLADREELARTNGFAHVHQGGHYEGETWVEDPPRGIVVLGGKRVPPHPAVTAYLVAHEFGHHAEWMINQASGARNLASRRTCREYLKVRGLPDSADHHGDGGTWHDSVHEIMACDFRVLVAKVETSYWPHPGVPEPGQVEGLEDWWAEQAAAHQERRSSPAL